jgi:hypothetical protein
VVGVVDKNRETAPRSLFVVEKVHGASLACRTDNREIRTP